MKKLEKDFVINIEDKMRESRVRSIGRVQRRLEIVPVRKIEG